MTAKRLRTETGVSDKTTKEPYEPPQIREVWDEGVGTAGLFLLEL
ncbi:MAG: hypothetical protein ACE5KH_02495 [Candidatus Geothermarchaeales archaeon]